MIMEVYGSLPVKGTMKIKHRHKVALVYNVRKSIDKRKFCKPIRKVLPFQSVTFCLKPMGFLLLQPRNLLSPDSPLGLYRYTAWQKLPPCSTGVNPGSLAMPQFVPCIFYVPKESLGLTKIV